MTLTQQQASAEIAKKIGEARTLIAECESIADQSGVDFAWDGPGYGMGGSYTPRTLKDTVTDPDDQDSWSASNEGWQASSQSC